MRENYGNEVIFYGWASSLKQEAPVNQLLKYDISNKQKFVDSISEQNPKLSLNIDVTPASPTTYDHHVTSEPQHIRETQNSERSDTEHNDPRKCDYKSNGENKKSDDNNK